MLIRPPKQSVTVIEVSRPSNKVSNSARTSTDVDGLSSAGQAYANDDGARGNLASERSGRANRWATSHTWESARYVLTTQRRSRMHGSDM